MSTSLEGRSLDWPDASITWPLTSLSATLAKNAVICFRTWWHHGIYVLMTHISDYYYYYYVGTTDTRIRDGIRPWCDDISSEIFLLHHVLCVDNIYRGWSVRPPISWDSMFWFYLYVFSINTAYILASIKTTENWLGVGLHVVMHIGTDVAPKIDVGLQHVIREYQRQWACQIFDEFEQLDLTFIT